MKDFFVKFFASCGFVGHIPFASGTFGTMVGVLMVYVTGYFIDVSVVNGKILYALITLVLIAFSIPISTAGEIVYRKKDSSKIVIDEAVSFFVTMMWLPLYPKLVLLGFLLNRVLDIVKIPPASTCQKKLPAGYGVVLDDIVSGVQSHIVLRVIIFLTGYSFFT